MRTFDARTTSDREAVIMRELAALQREARLRPARVGDLCQRARDLVPSMPLKVQVQTSTRCNAACAMCPYPVVTSEPGFEHATMSEERYLRILADLRGGGVERLSLFLMNEPLLDRRLPGWIARARAELPEVTLGLFTNGSALDGARASALASAGLDELSISVHGFDATTYERVMAGLSFERARRNLDEVLDAAAAGQLDPMHVQIVTGDVPEVARTTDVAPLRYRDRVVLKAFSNERAAVGVAADVPSTAGLIADSPCQRPFVKLYVLTTGECVLCNVDWRRTVILGRVGDAGGSTVADVWRGEPYMAVRLEHFTGAFARASICRRCDYAGVVDRE
jgi:hypothetical protein